MGTKARISYNKLSKFIAESDGLESLTSKLCSEFTKNDKTFSEMSFKEAIEYYKSPY